MKHSYLLLLLLLALPGRGQNFCPFRPGQLVQFNSPGNDTTLAVELRRGAAAVPGTSDSVYYLNRLASTQLVGGTLCPSYSHSNSGEGLLGSSLVLHNRNTMRATYELRGRIRILGPTGSPISVLMSILLQPRMPLRQPWPTNAGNARIIAKRVVLVLGQPDSVVDIELQQGNPQNPVISLSKNHGLITTYQFNKLVDGMPCPPHNLTAWPKQGLGASKVGVRTVYDYQVGDVLLYRFHRFVANNPSGPIQTDYYFGDSVLARTNSRTGDTITYQMHTRSRATGSLVVGTRTLAYTATGSYPLSRPTGQIYHTIAPSRGAFYILPAIADPARNGRAVQRLRGFSTCIQDSAFFLDGYNVDLYYVEKYGAGLGRVLLDDFDFFGTSTRIELAAYRKGTEQAGPIALWRRGLQALPARATRPAATTAAYPQPFVTDLTVAFVLARPQLVALTLRDALGRVVLLRPAAPLPAGNQQLILDTQRLPAGLYTLHLALEGEGRTEVLKVLKNNE